MLCANDGSNILIIRVKPTHHSLEMIPSDIFALRLKESTMFIKYSAGVTQQSSMIFWHPVSQRFPQYTRIFLVSPRHILIFRRSED